MSRRQGERHFTLHCVTLHLVPARCIRSHWVDSGRIASPKRNFHPSQAISTTDEPSKFARTIPHPNTHTTKLSPEPLIKSDFTNMSPMTRAMMEKKTGDLIQRSYQRDAALTTQQTSLRPRPKAYKSTTSLIAKDSLVPQSMRNLTTQPPLKKQPSSPADYLKASNLTTGCLLPGSSRTRDLEFHCYTETTPPRTSQKSTPPTEP